MLDIFERVFELLRNAWRFRWIALGVAWLAAICGWLFVYSIPDQYQSSARVHIDTQSAIHPLLSGMAVRPNVDRQVDLLIRTVLSRPNLEKIARRTGLDLKASTPEQMDNLIEQLDSRLSLRSTGGKLDLYRISVTTSNAKMAQSIVQEVIDIMTGMAAGDSGKKSTQAMGFLKREVQSYKDRLDETERKLSSFKKKNAQFMPGKNSYVSRVQSLVAQIDTLQDQLSSAQDRNKQLQARVNGSQSGGTRTIAPENSSQVRQLDQQISGLQEKVGRLLTKYTPKHPDVRSAKRQITRLKKKRARTIAGLRANPQRISVASGGSGLRNQLDEAQANARKLKDRLASKQAALEKLKKDADEMTDAQAQLAELKREYQINKDQYEKLLNRLYTAQLSEDADQNNNPLEFRVIDPPEVPSDASGPNRVLLITMALLGSLAAGGGFALLMSQMRPVYINRSGLTNGTGLPVLGSISVAWTRAQTARRRAALLAFMAGVGVLVLLYVGALMFAPLGTQLVPTFISGQWL